MSSVSTSDYLKPEKLALRILMLYAPCFLDMTSPKSNSNSFEAKDIWKNISQGDQDVLRYDHEISAL